MDEQINLQIICNVVSTTDVILANASCCLNGDVWSAARCGRLTPRENYIVRIIIS
jgi:hypothetical protein